MTKNKIVKLDNIKITLNSTKVGNISFSSNERGQIELKKELEAHLCWQFSQSVEVGEIFTDMRTCEHATTIWLKGN